MTYTVVQKVKDKYYLCEVDAVWDPVKKNSRQTRRYLGRCDKDGNLLDGNSSLNVRSKSFGQYYLMLKMAERSGTLDAATTAFGPENGKIIVALSIVRSLRVGRLDRTLDFVSESFLEEMMGIDTLQDWFPLQTAILNVESAFFRRKEVFSLLAPEGDVVIMEASALREKLRARDLEGVLPHTTYRLNNFPSTGVFVSLSVDGGHPFHFSFNHAVDADVESMDIVNKEVSEIAKGKVEFFLDLKDWNETRIGSVMSSGIEMTFPLSPESKVGRKILSDSVRMFGKTSDTYVHNGTVFKVYEKHYDIGGKSVRAVVLLNEKRKNDEMLTLYNLLEQLESDISRMTWSEDVESRIKRLYGADESLNMLSFSKSDDGHVSVTRKRKLISAMENHCGKTILLTTTEREWTELLTMWRKHTAIEFIARIFKTDLEGSAGVFPSVGSAYGAFLCEFLGSRIQSRLVEELSHTTFARRLDLMATTSELEKIKISRINGEWHLNEITPFQRSILESLDVEIPSDKVLRDMLDSRGR